MIHAVEINTEKKTRKKIDYFLVGCKAQGLQKGGFGCGLAIKSRKGKKKRQAERTGLRTPNFESVKVLKSVSVKVLKDCGYTRWYGIRYRTGT